MPRSAPFVGALALTLIPFAALAKAPAGWSPRLEPTQPADLLAAPGEALAPPVATPGTLHAINRRQAVGCEPGIEAETPVAVEPSGRDASDLGAAARHHRAGRAGSAGDARLPEARPADLFDGATWSMAANSTIHGALSLNFAQFLDGTHLRGAERLRQIAAESGVTASAPEASFCNPVRGRRSTGSCRARWRGSRKCASMPRAWPNIPPPTCRGALHRGGWPMLAARRRAGYRGGSEARLALVRFDAQRSGLPRSFDFPAALARAPGTGAAPNGTHCSAN